MAVKDILRRLEKLEQTQGGTRRYHVIRVPGVHPIGDDVGYEAAEKDARTKYEAEHGPIPERDKVFLLRLVNARKCEDASPIETPTETPAEVPQIAQDERPAPERSETRKKPSGPIPDPSEADRWRARREKDDKRSPWGSWGGF